ncbi:TPA: hypothetical protein UMT89_000433 [Stenotrophomonas maltophilia]|nr:hypothetical protein [Stenotrophomonas maltophilia]
MPASDPNKSGSTDPSHSQLAKDHDVHPLHTFQGRIKSAPLPLLSTKSHRGPCLTWHRSGHQIQRTFAGEVVIDSGRFNGGMKICDIPAARSMMFEVHCSKGIGTCTRNRIDGTTRGCSIYFRADEGRYDRLMHTMSYISPGEGVRPRQDYAYSVLVNGVRVNKALA